MPTVFRIFASDGTHIREGDRDHETMDDAIEQVFISYIEWRKAYTSESCDGSEAYVDEDEENVTGEDAASRARFVARRVEV